jgi:hypothetical protein
MTSMSNELQGYILLITCTRRKLPALKSWLKLYLHSKQPAFNTSGYTLLRVSLSKPCCRSSVTTLHSGNIYGQFTSSKVGPADCSHYLLTVYLSWPGENVSGQTKRAVAVALQITVGDIGAISGCLVYRPALSSNLYHKPNLISIGYLLFAILMTTYLWVAMDRENRRRDRLLSQGETEIKETEEDRIRLGDRSLHYRYQI